MAKLIEITHQELLENPVLLVFLLECGLHQSNLYEKEVFLHTPPFNSFMNSLKVLEKYLNIFKKRGGELAGGATIPRTDLKELGKILSQAEEEYFNKVFYDVKALIKDNVGMHMSKIYLTPEKDDHFVKFSYRNVSNGVSEVTKMLLEADVFQTEKNESIAQKVIDFVLCYEDAKAVADKCEFFEVSLTGETIYLGCFDEEIRFNFGDFPAVFSEDIQKFNKAIDDVNEYHQQIVDTFDGICEIVDLDLGLKEYHLKFDNPDNPTKSSIRSPYRNIRSDAHRVKLILDKGKKAVA